MAPKSKKPTPEELYWRRVMARAKAQQPGMDRALLAWFQDVRQKLAPAVVIDFIQNNDVDRMVSLLLSDDALDQISAPLSQQLFRQSQANIDYFKKSVPKAGAMRIGYDVKNPRHLEAVRTLDTKVIQRLKDDVRGAVRTFTEDGIRNAVGPRVVGRQLQNVVGLVPKQMQEVENFRRALEDHDVDKILSYNRRDARFDSRIIRGDYGPAEVAKWTERYRERRVAWNAETMARTATLDSLKAGERMTWESAVSQKLVDRDRLMKEWIGVMDMRERMAHRLMEKQKRHFDERFSNNELVPGESTYNCRCLARYFEERAIRRTSNRVPTRPPAIPTSPTPLAAPGLPIPVIPPALAPQQVLDLALAEAEERIVKYRVEHAVGFSQTGAEVLNKTSNLVDQVKFTDPEMALLKDAVMTHNHPSGTWGLSGADVAFAMDNELAEIRAVTPVRVSRMMRDGSAGWSRAYWDFVVEPVYQRHRRAVRVDLTLQVRAGQITPNDFSRLFPHELWLRVAKELGLNYVSEDRISP